MIKALLKKQLAEVFLSLFVNQKSSKRQKGRNLALTVGICVLIFVSVGAMVFGLGKLLCEPLVGAGFGWLYFTLMSLIAVVLGVVGSVFSTYASLYTPKDNDLLLAMPIPSSVLLLTRLFGVYITGLFYELIVMAPAILVWFLDGSPTPLGVVFSLLLPFVLSFFVLTLSCLLGLLVALIATHCKHKTLITMVLSIAFLGAYMYFYSKSYELIMDLVENADKLANGVKNIFYPFYQLGLAATGDALAMLIFTGLVLLLLGLCLVLLRRSFFRLAITKKGGGNAKTLQKPLSTGSMQPALFKKELRRLASSSVYMLNCAMGVLLMPALGVFLLIKGEELIAPLSMLAGADLMVLFGVAAICMSLSMIDTTAPSISLEGKHLWLLKVLPVPTHRVLLAKLSVQWMLSLPVAAFVTVCVLILVKPTFLLGLLAVLAVLVFIALCAAIGLCANLLFPNFEWSTEVAPVKQSMSVTVALFAPWLLVGGLGGLCYLTRELFSPTGFLALALALLALVTASLYAWLFTRGTRRFAAL